MLSRKVSGEKVVQYPCFCVCCETVRTYRQSQILCVKGSLLEIRDLMRTRLACTYPKRMHVDGLFMWFYRSYIFDMGNITRERISSIAHTIHTTTSNFSLHLRTRRRQPTIQIHVQSNSTMENISSTSYRNFQLVVANQLEHWTNQKKVMLTTHVGTDIRIRIPVDYPKACLRQCFFIGTTDKWQSYLFQRPYHHE